MLDFSVWPVSDADKERVQQYLRHEQLFKGEFEEAFGEKSAFCKPDEVKTYVTADWPALISKVSSDMLFGEPPIVSAGDDQKQLDALIATLNLWVTTLEASLPQSYRGAAILHLFWNKEAMRSEVEQIPAYNYYAELHPDSCRRLKSEAVAWFVDVGRIRYLRVDHHTVGRVTREAWRFGSTSEVGLWHFKRKLDRVSLADVYPNDPVPLDVEETGLNRSALFYVPNMRDDGFWGLSDYSKPLETLFDSYNERLSDNQGTLHAHADPKLLIPEGVLDEQGEITKDDLDVIEIPPDSANGDSFKYLTWDGQLFPAFKQLDLLAALIYKFSEISPAIFGEDKAGSIESGRAMKFRFQRTISKMARKAAYWGPVLRDLLYWAQRLAADKGQVLELPDGTTLEVQRPSHPITVTLQDGLPQDVKEQVEIETLRQQSNLASPTSSIRRIDGCSQAAAEAELQKIKSEKGEQPGGSDPSHPPDSGPPSGGLGTGQK